MHLPFLETMITQVCNLSCQGCTNYSDLPHSGYKTWNQGKLELEAWLSRLDILDFGIMGGEPLINPEWKQWLQGTRQLMPQAQIRFTTNGLLLHKFPDIIDLFESVGNVVFKVTVHVANRELETMIESIKKARAWTPVVEHGIARFCGPNNLRLQINRPKSFLKTFKNSYADMMPWNSDPNDAFALCCQKTCPLLHNGRIYKCSTAGLLSETLARFRNPNYEHWLPFLDNGIGPTDTDEDLELFCQNFGHANPICGQCPSQSHDMIDHTSNVIFKNKNFSSI
jgi:organic radical activating enzyme